jgi:hypothetical protein
MPMIPLKTRAWSAGIIDGEGSIGWQKNGHGNGRCPIVQVSNTDGKICKILYNHWGGKLYFRRTRKDRPRNKPIWQWRIMVRKCCIFLKDIEKYLISKREKAKEVLKSK